MQKTSCPARHPTTIALVVSSIVQAKGTRGEFALAILVEVEVHAAGHHDTSCLACGHALKRFKWLGKTVLCVYMRVPYRWSFPVGSFDISSNTVSWALSELCPKTSSTHWVPRHKYAEFSLVRPCPGIRGQYLRRRNFDASVHAA